MHQVKMRFITLNLHYFSDFPKNDTTTENFGELFFDITNNSFGQYVVYLQIYFRVFLNLITFQNCWQKNI